MITDRFMPDVLKSTTTVSGELCVMMALTTQTHKSPAICSDLGEVFNISEIPPVNVAVEFLSTLVTAFVEVCCFGWTVDVCSGDPVCIWVTTTAVAQDQSGWTTSSVLAMRCL